MTGRHEIRQRHRKRGIHSGRLTIKQESRKADRLVGKQIMGQRGNQIGEKVFRQTDDKDTVRQTDR